MTAEDDHRRVLELRVHGVNNTPPAAILDLPADQIEEVVGDENASFWRPKVPAGPPGKESRGHVPPGITREAYSWGGLARMTPAGAVGLGGKLMAGLITAGWTLLLPFGLANLAYWTRRVDGRGLPPKSGKSDPHPRTKAGATVVRLFGLLLTAFLVVTISDLSMDLVAAQCFSDDTETLNEAKLASGAKKTAVLGCTRLPGFLGGLASLDTAPRLAVLSVVPIAALLGLWFISSVSRARYERAVETNAGSPGTKSGGAPPPVLARPEMWRGDVMVGGLAQLHLAAGFALIALCLMWPALFGSGNSCSQPGKVLGRDCKEQVAALGSEGLLYKGSLVLSLLVLLACVVLIVCRASDAPDIDAPGIDTSDIGPGTIKVLRAMRVPWAIRVLRAVKGLLRWLSDKLSSKVASIILLIVALLDIAYAEVVMFAAHPEIEVQVNLLGVSAAPTILIVLMLGLVAWALFLRLSRLGWIWAILLVASLGCLMVRGHAWPRVAVGVVVLGMVLHLAALPDDSQRRWQGWAGMGPGMFLGAALWAQTFLSSALVLCVGDWLNGSKGASTLIRKQVITTEVKMPKLDECGNLCPGQGWVLSAPMPYLLLGAAALLAAIVAGVGLGIAWLRSGPEPAENIPPAVLEGRVLSARRFARVAHRAEKLFGLLAVTGVLLVLAVAMTTTGGWLEDRGASWLRPLDLSTPAVAIIGVSGLAALVKGTSTGKKRPLGLLWDLVAFLPRAAHPFAPPCYAERAVPELADRVSEWLKEGDRFVGDQRRGGHRVVISAHSLGGVLTVAALMREPLLQYERQRSIRLLTYGSQLRAYFGRIFPELLGPAILGTPASRAALFWAHDPWEAERHPDEPEQELKLLTSGIPPVGGRDFLDQSSPITRRLSGGETGVLWRNLWRPTDYLGFPLWSFPRTLEENLDPTAQPGNPIDVRRTQEVDESGYLLGVLTHSNYPRTPAYTSALLTLAGLPEEREDTRPGRQRRRRLRRARR